jgi:hypothetical protein
MIIYSVDKPGTPKVSKGDLEYTSQKHVAFQGLCRVEAAAEEFFGGSRSKPYVGRVLESPTWGKLLAEARKVQRATRDEHHVFLEGASVRHVEGSVQVIELFFGS